MKERRRTPRVNLKRGIIWRGQNTLDNLDQGINISEGGMSFIVNNDQLTVDDLIQLSFRLPTKKTIQAKAKVKWTLLDQPTGSMQKAGVEFVDVGNPQRQEIRHFVGVCRYGCD
ncbi:MAG: PilZ domain-containing protein [Candidatus Omnitrophica bacterium]|nr:PilZ domain-containing protein [Candidatus Omnitrophota bacterium]